MKKNTPTIFRHAPKYAYYLLFGSGIALACFRDFNTATILLGISLAFDPFDQQTPFAKRPLWQKIWPVTHLAIMSIVFGLSSK